MGTDMETENRHRTGQRKAAAHSGLNERGICRDSSKWVHPFSKSSIWDGCVCSLACLPACLLGSRKSEEIKPLEIGLQWALASSKRFPFNWGKREVWHTKKQYFWLTLVVVIVVFRFVWLLSYTLSLHRNDNHFAIGHRLMVFCFLLCSPILLVTSCKPLCVCVRASIGGRNGTAPVWLASWSRDAHKHHMLVLHAVPEQFVSGVCVCLCYVYVFCAFSCYSFILLFCTICTT